MPESFWKRAANSMKESFKEANEEVNRKEAIRKEQKEKKKAGKTNKIGFFEKVKEDWNEISREQEAKENEKVKRKTEKLLDWHRETLRYVEQSILQAEEEIIKFIEVDFGKLKEAKINGILLATSQRLVYVYKRKNEQYTEDFSYSKIKGLKLVPSGFKYEIHFTIGSTKKIFYGIKDNSLFRDFVDIVKDRINSSPAPRSRATKSPDKYKQLEQIGKLKEQGILTDEEFQNEKRKILGG